jgi:monofunctional biosynthetic peptidoglycan transglycosylase
MGDGVYGAEAAAKRYFHGNAKSLNAEEAALLVATFPNPRKWAPPHSPRHVYRRQGWILRQMPAFIGRPELR